MTEENSDPNDSPDSKGSTDSSEKLEGATDAADTEDSLFGELDSAELVQELREQKTALEASTSTLEHELEHIKNATVRHEILKKRYEELTRELGYLTQNRFDIKEQFFAPQQIEHLEAEMNRLKEIDEAKTKKDAGESGTAPAGDSAPPA